MRRISPAKIIVLALMLAVSHVALISHVTAHFAPNLEQCELCVSQAQLLTAIPSSDHGFLFDTGFGEFPFHSTERTAQSQLLKAYHQRAPPLLPV